MKKTTMIAAAAVLFASFNAGADVYFCSPQGSGSGDGSSWDDAYPAADINEVLSAVEPGDFVYLLEGTYTGTAIRPVSGITVIGGFPASSKGTDLSLYNPWQYKTVFDAEGKNGFEAFVKISRHDDDADLLTTMKGITITGAVGEKDESDSYHGTAFNCTRSQVLLEDMTFDGNSTIKGGVVVPASGSKFHAKHCVWTNNVNKRTEIGASDGANNCFQPVLSARGASDNQTNVVLEGCVMVKNTIESAEGRAAACYGGMMNFQDGSCSCAMINCFSDGDGLKIKQNGGFMRMGNGALGSTQLLVMAFNTLYNYETAHATESKGHVISINGNTPYYLQGNIIVDKQPGASVTPSADGTSVSVGNKLDLAMFTQGFSENHGNKVPLIQSGGDNAVGGFLVATIAKAQANEPGSMYKTTFLTDFPSDNWSAPAQTQVFAGATTPKDGRYFVLPAESYKDVNTAKAIENYSSYADQQVFKELFGFADIDLSVDLFGNKRAATTYRGAYDPNATKVEGSGVKNLVAADCTMFTVKALGGGQFAINGAEGEAAVYDMAGRKVLSQQVENGTVLSLAALNSGVYVINIAGASVKVIL